MNKETIEKALTNSLEDLKTVEEKLGFKLGPKSVSEQKTRELHKQLSAMLPAKRR